MDILERKWKLMQRDPLCFKFDEVLCDSIRDWENDELGDKRKKLTQEVREKWCVKIYVPENTVKMGRMFENHPKDPNLTNLKKEDFLGPFRWWTISGESHPIVIDARVGGGLIWEGEWLIPYGFQGNGLIYCEPHKIPIIIDPSTLSPHDDADKVRKAVWNIVKDELDKRKLNTSAGPTEKKGGGWNPPLPQGEPEELSQALSCKKQIFEKYLRWYKYKVEGGLTFRLIAVIKTKEDIEEQNETYERVARGKKKPKIGKDIPGESNVRGGFKYIYKAIHRNTAPKKEQEIEKSSRLAIEKYHCPQHSPSKCPPDCAHMAKWLTRFDNLTKDVPLSGKQVDSMELDKFFTRRLEET